jgi:dihydropteroate synthase
MLISRVEDTHFPVNRHFRLKDKLVSLRTPKVMGIINITIDSFYAESRISNDKELLLQVQKMILEGAEIIDIGACSTRPGSKEIPLEEEVKKVANAVQLIRKEFPEIILSVDTYRSEVAESGIESGADIINDISGGQIDPKILDVVAKNKVPYILMHMFGTPENMQDFTQYDNIFMDMVSYFSERISILEEKGIHDIIIDPGFGFSKTLEQNYQILNSLEQFQLLGKPILVGISRKSMIYRKLNISSEEALNGTTILNTLAIVKGASILRVHDVKEAKEIISLLP